MNESLKIEVGGKLFVPQSLEGAHTAVEVPPETDGASPVAGETKKEVTDGAYILLGVLIILIGTVIHGAIIEIKSITGPHNW